MFQYREYIYEIYKKKSFSKAAKSLYISQPALSNVVKKVEDELNVTLFDRSTSPIKLTTAGEYYIQAVEKVMKIEDETKRHLNTISENSKNSVYVCCSTFFCFHVMPEIINIFKQSNPEISVRLIEVNANEFEECVNSGFADIGITVDDINKEKFKIYDWVEENIVLAVPGGFEINKKLKEYMLSYEDLKSGAYLSDKYPAVSLSQFSKEPFLFLKRGNDMYTRGLNMCKDAGFYPNILMYMDQYQTSYALAKQGRGIIFTRDSIVKYESPTDDLAFYKIDDINAKRKIRIFRSKKSEINSAQKFIDYLTK
ncbi:LYSR family transcriptional regulatory protein [Peptoniphilus sp. ING2-D1G]|nr:LYSR family transcriptional regulatory protein [Peptoniphilus sp. ING2-D1G]